MDNLSELLMESLDTNSPVIAWAIMVVGILVIICAIVGLVISIWLAIRYAKYNKRQNSRHITGEAAAREILDKNGLQNIKVTASGSFLFGNSYSHYFKKVRLRRRTYKKDSIASLAMAAQKSALAVLDKERDPDMLRRNKLIPLVTFGPFAFIPLVIIGVLLDLLVDTTKNGMFTVVFAILGLAFYVFSFILSIVILRIETKGQKKAYEILRENALATESEIQDIKELFKLYNIEYINNMILAFLEMLLRILQIVAAANGGYKSSSN